MDHMDLLYDNNTRFMPHEHLPERVLIWDETLRDGEQTPGVAFHIDEKKAIARALAEAGVAVIDAGMPIVSDDERSAIRQIVEMGLPAEVGVTVRTHEADLIAARECGVSNVYMFLSVSPLHMRCKFGMSSYAELQEIAVRHVALARQMGFTPTFIAEDSTGARPEDLVDLFTRLYHEGMERVIICDTAVRMPAPMAFYHFVRHLIAASPRELTFCVHCHNDLGEATANTVMAILAGVQIPTVTMNGIGERAGNAALEQTVVTLEKMGVSTGVNLDALTGLSRLVARHSGIPLAMHSPVVGLNAFRHESGIHAAGVLEDPRTYETILPEEVGRQREIIFGKHSGRHQLVALLERHGIPHTRETVDWLLSEIKRLKEQQSHNPLEAMVESLDAYYRANFGIAEDTILALARERVDGDMYADAA
jgi:isopropylmalate/homocitrate/citramalate synthase